MFKVNADGPKVIVTCGEWIHTPPTPFEPELLTLIRGPKPVVFDFTQCRIATERWLRAIHRLASEGTVYFVGLSDFLKNKPEIDLVWTNLYDRLEDVP